MSKTSIPKRVIIAGAGLAGPALAIALAKHSIRSIILERRPTMEDIGGVIMLGPNAMRVMDKVLGLDTKIREAGYNFESIHIHVQSGDKFTHAGGFAIGNEVKAVTIGRPKLHEILVEEAKKLKDLVEVRYDARLEKIDETEDGVTVHLRGGGQVSGDLVIGADGIGSDVRKHILGDKNPAPEYSGLLFIGNLVETSKIKYPAGMEPPSFCYNPHGAFLSFVMDESREQMQWATSIEMPERERKNGWKEYQESGDAVRDLRKEYADTKAEPIRSFVDSLTSENAKLWAPYSVPPLPTWHTRRTCILGDAAHAIPPSVGQGSAMAFEDIGLLSRLLGSEEAVSNGYDAVFEYFEKTRRKRVDMIRKAAANAEGARRPTTNAWFWWAKTVGVRAGMWMFGKGGYLSGSAMTTYDVTKESLNVRRVAA